MEEIAQPPEKNPSDYASRTTAKVINVLNCYTSGSKDITHFLRRCLPLFIFVVGGGGGGKSPDAVTKLCRC